MMATAFLIAHVLMTYFFFAFGLPTLPAAITPPTTGSCAMLPRSDMPPLSVYNGTQTGAATLWGHGDFGPKKWQDLYIQGLTVIPYCYTDAGSRKVLKDKVESAMKLWYAELGGGPSKETRHKIYFHEWTDLGWFGARKVRYCLDPYSKIADGWNAKLPYKTLAIFEDPDQSESGVASMGMGHQPGYPWDLMMWLAKDANVPTIAHELGHVMGLDHEHQRADRDYYVRFDCMKLTDYDKAVFRARADDPTVTVDQLCTDPRVAEKYHFSAANYAILQEYEGHWGWTNNAESPYDVWSIMHYSSYQLGNELCQKGYEYECPIKRYIDSTIHSKGMEMIPLWFKPSAWDANWVQMTYPYTGCPSCDRNGGPPKTFPPTIGSDDGPVVELSAEMLKLLDKAGEEYVRNQV